MQQAAQAPNLAACCILVLSVVPTNFLSRIKKRFNLPSKYVLMKILATTDFSDTAHNALISAVKLARCYGAEVIFMHAMSRPVVPATSPADVYESIFDMEGKQAQERLQEESRIVYQEVGLRPTELYKQVVILSTPLADAILQALAKNNVDLVVMGSSGNSGLVRFFMGSNTLEMINLTPVPLLVIPKKYQFAGFKVISIMMALEELKNRPGLRILERFVRTFSSEIHFLFIQGTDDPEVCIRELIQGNNVELPKEASILHKFISKGNEKQELKQHLQKSATDLLVIFPKKSTLWKDTFSGSLTEEVAEKFNLPLLVIPQQRLPQ
ncbi:universal stress protein [Pontibacter locisalis]|uniref:Universal stress protein n=1 Tax=Pontibacter locisalis TaxID=1719035 RepID=A0ABW5IRP8_9BACT